MPENISVIVEISQKAVSDDIANYMRRNWTHEQIAEFCVKMLGALPIGNIIDTFRVYILRFVPREEQVRFCLHILGDEAQAWYARKEAHQE